MAYMKVVFLLAAAFLSVTYCFSYSKPVYTRNLATTVCEGKTQHIQCGSGKLINIISASFGRKSRSVCPSSTIKTTNCHSTQSLTKVKASCNRKSSCELNASTSIFGDPCFGTYKYLTIQYQCVLSELALGNGGGCKVQLFQHNGYKGVVDTYTQGGNVKRNDDMSSLKVEGGCCVVIYEHYNWKGKNQKYCKNTGSIGGKWNDKVSSIKIVSHDENEEGFDEKDAEEEDAEDENEDKEEMEKEVEDEYELAEEEDAQVEDDDESKEE